jgi:hypothetical protein
VKQPKSVAARIYIAGSAAPRTFAFVVAGGVSSKLLYPQAALLRHSFLFDLAVNLLKTDTF